MIDTHNLIVDFGKHRGERYTRVPVSYLRWMVNDKHREANVARAELERRGIPLIDRLVEISGHAIDSASLRCIGRWKKTRRDKNEGLNAWLQRVAEEALNAHEPDSQGVITNNGVRLVFGFGELYPTLKTVMPARMNRKTPRRMRHFDNVDEENNDEQDTRTAAAD